MNLKSSVNEIGETVTQIFHFRDGSKRTFSGIIPTTIKDGSFTKMKTKDGRMLLINPDNVNIIEVFKEE
jgi:hypothetical protein